MIIGYARTSTADQVASLEAQLEELKMADCEKLFSEQVSSVAARAQLENALDFVREGDVLVVNKHLTVLGSIAQFEREMMLERQHEGVIRAKAAGKYKGRKPIDAERRNKVIQLVSEGITKANIASQLGIGEAIIYRILADNIQNKMAIFAAMSILAH